MGTLGGIFFEGNGWIGVISMIGGALVLIAVFAIRLQRQNKN